MNSHRKLVLCKFAREPSLVPAGTGVARFIDQHQWAKSAVELQQHMHEAVCQHVEPLNPQPTTHSSEGLLSVVTPSAEVTVSSHAGEHNIR
jgi:hypothetical protein